jgi:hypothetical protein
MQQVARLHGYFSNDSLLSVIQDILKLPQEGRINIKNTDDGAWGNIYHRKQQILEVNCQTLRGDQALERMIAWKHGDYLYYALKISDDLEKKPISERLFQTLFGTRETAHAGLEPRADVDGTFRKRLRKKLIEGLGPIADYLLAEAFEQSGIDPEAIDVQTLASFQQALYSVTPATYHDTVRAVLLEFETR